MTLKKVLWTSKYNLQHRSQPLWINNNKACLINKCNLEGRCLNNSRSGCNNNNLWVYPKCPIRKPQACSISPIRICNNSSIRSFKQHKWVWWGQLRIFHLISSIHLEPSSKEVPTNRGCTWHKVINNSSHNRTNSKQVTSTHQWSNWEVRHSQLLIKT